MTRYHLPACRKRPLALTLCTLLATTALPALADPSCVDANGNPVGGSTNQGNEHGDNNATCHADASAYGEQNNASGASSTAFGRFNVASGFLANAFGTFNTASNNASNAFGNNNAASGWGSNAFGTANEASGSNSNAFGKSNDALSQGSSAFGYQNTAADENASAFGYSNSATGKYASAFGYSNSAIGKYASAVGAFNEATNAVSSAIGTYNVASGLNSSAVGTGNKADGLNSSAFGNGSVATGAYASAFGYQSVASNIGSVAIGYLSVADRDYAVSVGKAGGEHQIIHLADGTEDYDAVNVRQLRTLADWMGGGSSFAGGVFTAPSFVIQGSSYTNVGAAFAAVDSKLTALSGSGGVAGPAGDSAYQVAVGNGFVGTEQQWLASLQGGTGAAGPAGADGASAYEVAVTHGFVGTEEQWLASLGGSGGYDELAAHYDDADKGSLTLQGANGTQVKNVADGVDATDAVNVRQMEAGDAATLSASRAYTDERWAAWNDSFTQYQQGVDRRFAQTDKRIDRIGAMGSAMTHMAVNAANGTGAKGRIAIGLGTQGGQGAVSIGYGKRVGSRGSFSLGASFGSGDSTAGAGFGFDL